MKPFMRYPGGKARLAPLVWERLLAAGPLTDYWEPMLGAGAVALAAPPEVRLHLSDASQTVMDLWRAVMNDPVKLYADIGAWAVELRVSTEASDEALKAAARRLREVWNVHRNQPALGLLLRSLAYNGLWRVNRQGKLNTTFEAARIRRALGPNPPYPTLDHFVAVAEFLRARDARLSCCDFEDVKEDDLAGGHAFYFDPPYHNDDPRAHTAYTRDGFGEAEQTRLIQACARLAGAGASVVYSNAPTDFIRDQLARHWPDACVEGVDNHRSISRDGAQRGDVRELLVTGYSLRS